MNDQGLLLCPDEKDTRYKFRIEMGWGNNQDQLFRWLGEVSVQNGHILDAEPCFRGRSVLAPSSVNTDGFDDVNDIDSRLLEVSEQRVSWQCFSVKNVSPLHPLTSAVIFELEGSPDTQVTIEVNGQRQILTVAQLMRGGYSAHTKPYHSQAFNVHPIFSESEYTVSGCLTDLPESNKDFYHMEVYQANGCCAFVTPVYFK